MARRFTRDEAVKGQRASVAVQHRRALARAKVQAQAYELAQLYEDEGVTVAAQGASIALGLEIAEKTGKVRVETAADLAELAKAMRHTHAIYRMQMGQSTSNTETHAVVSSDEYTRRLVDAEQRLRTLRDAGHVQHDANSVDTPPALDA